MLKMLVFVVFSLALLSLAYTHDSDRAHGTEGTHGTEGAKGTEDTEITENIEGKLVISVRSHA